MANTEATILISSASSTFSGGDGRPQLENATQALENLGSALSTAADNFWDALARSSVLPNEVELALEFAFDGKGKWLVVEAGASAKASVKLKWIRKG